MARTGRSYIDEATAGNLGKGFMGDMRHVHHLSDHGFPRIGFDDVHCQ